MSNHSVKILRMNIKNPFKNDIQNLKSAVMLTEKSSRLRTRINLKLYFGEYTSNGQKCQSGKWCRHPSRHLATLESEHFIHITIAVTQAICLILD